jgi:pilus assembly protein CpaD
MNRLPPYFGCAVVRNFGLMLAEPADLIAPRPAGDRDATRSDVIVRKYRAGEPTGAKGAQDEREIRRGTTNRR